MKMSPTELARCDGGTTREALPSLTRRARSPNADAPHPLGLLRVRSQRPRSEKISRRILSGDQGMLVWWSIGAGVAANPRT
jgi:hypothetical protein